MEHPTNILTREMYQEALIARHGGVLQEKLSKGRVAIAGLGGLGSNVAFYLARIGVGHLHLLDFDQVDLSNLNRQEYRIQHLGMYKTEALKQQLLEINPFIEITTSCVRVTEENLSQLLGEEEIICEAFDAPEAKAMLLNGVLEQFPDTWLVTASGMAGYGDSNTIQTRRIMGNVFLCGDGSTGIQEGMGLMAPRVAICAAHQGNIITRILAGDVEKKRTK